MMYPILCKVRYETLHLLLRSKQLWIQLLFSFVLNWIIAPFFMLGLAWAFLPDRSGLREGLIYVGIARCIAMVLIWTDLAGGDGDYCAVLVAFNSILQIVLFAPLSIFVLKVISHDSNNLQMSYSTVAISVAVFLGKLSFFSVGLSPLMQFPIRHTSWRRDSHTFRPSHSSRREILSASFHPLHRTTVTRRPHLHNSCALRLSGCTRCAIDHLSAPCRRTADSLLYGRVRRNNAGVSMVGVRI